MCEIVGKSENITAQAIDLLTHFENLDDPRQSRKTTYPLNEILLLVLCGVLSGANDWVAIALYGAQKRDLLRRFLPFENGTPSHDQLGKLFSVLDAKQFQTCFASWVEAFQSATCGVVAIDGKVLRRSFDKADKRAAINMVSAWCSEQNLVLAQTAVDKKSNEIRAIPELLDMLCLKGAIVKIDAIGCQRNIAEKITAKGADYVLALKGNQGCLHDRVVRLFDKKNIDKNKTITMTYDKSKETSHGRLETRKVTVCGDVEWLQKHNPWPGLKTIVRFDYTAKLANGKQRKDRRFYISSLPTDARLLAKAIRDHWGIENGLHWVMDMLFRDDESRVRKGNSAANFTTVKHIASNLLRSNKQKISLRV